MANLIGVYYKTAHYSHFRFAVASTPFDCRQFAELLQMKVMQDKKSLLMTF